MNKVRVRFAPSPTGALHMGGVRTALFNYLFAKHHNGDFLLRIEDTDQKRYVPGAEEYIIKSLEWCGLIPDEGPTTGGNFGPYRQSERNEIYQEHIKALLIEGKAYYAFDTAEELDVLRQEAEKKGQAFLYNSSTRKNLKNSLNLPQEEVDQLLSSKTPYVIRFKIPEDQTIRTNDIIRGTVIVNSNTLDDKVLFKSDGLPTYHFANIVDDHLMKISHVIRGEEWLPSLPLHLLLYEAFGWEAPQFAHLPLILKPEGKGKLSKRDGEKLGFPVFPLAWNTEEGSVNGYKEFGYFPEAFINILALLGWNPGTEEEIMDIETLIQKFDINKVNKSGARFNPKKAIWFNQQYLQKKSNEDILPEFQKILEENNITTNDSFDEKIIDLVKERANFIYQIWEQAKSFYIAPNSFDEKGLSKVWKNDTKEILLQFLELNNKIENYSAEKIHDEIHDFVKNNEIGFGKIMMPLRLSIVGALQGPDIPIMMEIIGKENIAKRIEFLINTKS